MSKHSNWFLLRCRNSNHLLIAMLINFFFSFRLSLEEIFNELTASKDPIVRRDASAPDHIVQKYLILDQVSQLMEEMSRWIQGSDMSVGNDCEPISPHFLRFLTHLVLFLRRIGRSECESIGDAVIEAYVKVFVENFLTSNYLFIYFFSIFFFFFFFSCSLK